MRAGKKFQPAQDSASPSLSSFDKQGQLEQIASATLEVKRERKCWCKDFPNTFNHNSPDDWAREL